MIDYSILKGKTALYYTLGCKLNFSETSTLARKLEDVGVKTVYKDGNADICIINTCTVTDVADQKSRQIIRRAIRQNPNAFIVVTGCYAQLNAFEFPYIKGVNLVLGTQEKADLVKHLAESLAKNNVQTTPQFTLNPKDIKKFSPSCSNGNRTRYFLKVQDGCDYYCTYCTIPFARGRSRNPSIESLVNQAKEVVERGGKEIVLTGVNIGDFGKTTNETFLNLIKALDDVEGMTRYRISSIEPDLLSDEIIDFVANSKSFMPHFHIPLQSGSDTILKLMNRRYDTKLFAHKIALIKEKIPNAFIGIDVIAGPRGEKNEIFKETYEFLEKIEFSELHVFPYSERPKTRALQIPYTVSDLQKKARVKKLMKLSLEKRKAFYSSFIGQTANVLFEKPIKGKLFKGFTENYIKVSLPEDEDFQDLDNKIKKVHLLGFNQDKSELIARLDD